MNSQTLNRFRKASILVVEDESIVRADLEEHLKSLGCRVAASVASGEEAKRLSAELGPDLVLMDIILAGKIDGIEAGKFMHRKLCIPVVFVTAHGDENTLSRAKLNAPFGYVLKPFNDRELHTAIELAIFRHRAEEELHRLQEWLRAILDNMEEAVVVTDKWGFITLFNERAVALTGWQERKAIGKALNDVVRLVYEATRQPLSPPLNEVLLQQAGQWSKQRFMLATGRGSGAPVQFSIAPMADSAGKVNGAILKLHTVQT
jgi:PAS domain S-box-containing protein